MDASTVPNFFCCNYSCEHALGLSCSAAVSLVWPHAAHEPYSQRIAAFWPPQKDSVKIAALGATAQQINFSQSPNAPWHPSDIRLGRFCTTAQQSPASSQALRPPAVLTRNAASEIADTADSAHATAVSTSATAALVRDAATRATTAATVTARCRPVQAAMSLHRLKPCSDIIERQGSTSGVALANAQCKAQEAAAAPISVSRWVVPDAHVLVFTDNTAPCIDVCRCTC